MPGRPLDAAARALNSGQTSSGTLLCRLRILYARQRWRSERGKHSSMAHPRPSRLDMAGVVVCDLEKELN
jgi:hypothetical protein